MVRSRGSLTRIRGLFKKNRQIAGRPATSHRPATKQPSGSAAGALKRKLLSVALAAGIMAAPLSARAMGGPEPASNPALRAGVKTAQVTNYDRYYFDRQLGVFLPRFSLRVANLKNWGAVVYLESLSKTEGKAKYAMVGLAQDIRIPGGVLLKLGIKTPQLGKGKVDFEKSDIGLIITRGKFLLEAHRLGETGHPKWGAIRGSAGFKVRGGSSVEASYGGEGYYSSSGPAVRFGANRLQELLGIDLGKLSVDMGYTMPEQMKGVKQQRGKADVSLVYPLKIGGLDVIPGVDFINVGRKDVQVAGYLVVNF